MGTSRLMGVDVDNFRFNLHLTVLSSYTFITASIYYNITYVWILTCNINAPEAHSPASTLLRLPSYLNQRTLPDLHWHRRRLLDRYASSFPILFWTPFDKTMRKLRGSSSDEVDIFNLPNPSSRTMALGSTQTLTEMSIRNLPAR
jgi:hypothetical protein